MSKLTKRIVDQADHARMIAELDAKGLEAGKAASDPARKLFIWDDVLPGFGLSITATGVKTYVVQYRTRTGRQSRRLAIGRHGVLSTEQARAEAQQILAAVARGADPAAARSSARGAPTVNELGARYLEEHAGPKKRPRSVAEDERMLEAYVKKTIGSRKVSEISEQDAARLHHKMRATPYQANRLVALLAKIFDLAEKWGHRPRGSNPFRWIEKYPEDKRRRYLSPVELRRIGEALATLEAKDPDGWPPLLAIRLLLLTGARAGEILTLKWEHVDLQHAALNLPQSKTGAKTIPLSAQAVGLLLNAPRIEGQPYVIPSGKTGGHLAALQSPWRRVKAAVDAQQAKEIKEKKLKPADKVDVSDVRIHDLRHTFASIGAGAGFGLPMIGALLGHTQAQTTARYAHLAADPLRQVADAISGEIEAALNGREPGKVVELRSEEGS